MSTMQNISKKREVEIETKNNNKIRVNCYLNVDPVTFDGYMEITCREINYHPIKPGDYETVISQDLGKKWKIVGNPVEIGINDSFHGQFSDNNPPAYRFT
ncbi:hypothetical protein [Gloeothece verrucosa]|uniref:Uncharacterized protein n=1 Tax=Gloeothece verrucosa (strain PCC 7822) TaxID=497965 RepID=E0UBQ1_GLOV7|nr:hypothetical protein [Gloeothece verrucosa]ADN13995.1 hypothetical protein Cyan7822_2013 [Gloeothece verrucosa PCC 7822]